MQPANAHGIVCCQCLLVIVGHLIGHIPQWYRPKDLSSRSPSIHCESLPRLLEAASKVETVQLCKRSDMTCF